MSPGVSTGHHPPPMPEATGQEADRELSLPDASSTGEAASDTRNTAAAAKVVNMPSQGQLEKQPSLSNTHEQAVQDSAREINDSRISKGVGKSAARKAVDESAESALWRPPEAVSAHAVPVDVGSPLLCAQMDVKLLQRSLQVGLADPPSPACLLAPRTTHHVLQQDSHYQRSLFRAPTRCLPARCPLKSSHNTDVPPHTGWYACLVEKEGATPCLGRRPRERV